VKDGVVCLFWASTVVGVAFLGFESVVWIEDLHIGWDGDPTIFS